MLSKATHIKPAKGFFKGNRARLVTAFKSKFNCPDNSVILLRGEVEAYCYDDDQTYKFSQDNKFFWATGCDQAGAYCLIHISNGDCVIYTPRIEAFRKYWERILEVDEYKERFEVEDSKELEYLEKDLETLSVDTIFILGGGVNKYSGVAPLAPDFAWLSKFKVNNADLYRLYNEVMLKKTDDELTLLKEAARIGSEAHIFVMQNVRPEMNESHIQTLFRFYCKIHGPTVDVPYNEICAADANAAVLHYHHNSDRVHDGQMILMDAGTKINGYCSDITSTFPVNGKFTEKQKHIYDIVLAAHLAVRNYVKAGVHWQDAHNLAEKTILQGLLDLGLIKGGTAEELWQKRICYYFFPHGLGHYIGTYVHDLIGDPEKEEQKTEIEKQRIRFYRVLEQSMVVTNEPGLYFIPLLIESAKKDESVSHHFDFDKIAQYQNEIKGVRIEGMMIVHADHAEELTRLPRTTDQIERCMAGQPWE